MPRHSGEARHLARLVADPSGRKRDDIYLAVATLYRHQGEVLSERERALMRDILLRLADEVEMAIRVALAERLADDDAVPLELILLLIDDHIEIARPLILRNARLGDAELLDLIAHADDARRSLCAERPFIGESVTAALAGSDAETVLAALVRNVTARFSGPTYEALVEKSRLLPALQEPLALRADLPPPLAERMCHWASEGLKKYLVEHRIMPARRAAALTADASRDVSDPQPSGAANNARKLVDKLAVAGELRAGFLLRVLQQGQTELFDFAFAKLLDMEDCEDFRRLFYAGGPYRMALACRAVGIDRSVFSTVVRLTAHRTRHSFALDHDGHARADGAFRLAKLEALARFHAPS